MLPAGLVFIALFNLSTKNENAFADRLITHMKLDGTTATIVPDMFGNTSNNALAASIAVVIGFLVWGLSIGQHYQDVYARAWGVEVSAATDQLLFAIFFFVFSGVIAALFGSASELRSAGWAIAIPVWIVGSLLFWLFTPRFLLHRKVPLRSLLPGALLATFVIGGTLFTSPLWIGPGLNESAKTFGSFGVFLGLFGYILITITISMVCAVFAPVWAEWRQNEKARKEPGGRTDQCQVGAGDPVGHLRSLALDTVRRGSCQRDVAQCADGPGLAVAGARAGDRGGAQHRPCQGRIRAQGSGRQAGLARPARVRGRHGRSRLRRRRAAAA